MKKIKGIGQINITGDRIKAVSYTHLAPVLARADIGMAMG